MRFFFSGVLLSLSILLFTGCNIESPGKTEPDIAINKIPVILPDDIDIDVYRIEITSEDAEPVIYYEKHGSKGLSIAVPADVQSQLHIEGYKNELLVFSSKETIKAGQNLAILLNPDDPTPIFPPSQISVTLTNATTIQLSWSECAGAVSYIVYRTADTLVTPEKLQTVTGLSLTDNYSIGTTYYYQVKAQFLNGISDPTSLVSAISDNQNVSTTPEPPSTINYRILHDSTINIYWHSSIGATGYNLYRSENECCNYTPAGTVSDTFFTTALNTGIPNYFKISTNAAGGIESSLSPSIKIQITKSSLAAPSGLTTQVLPSGSIQLAFQQSEGAISYIIYRGTSSTNMVSIDTTDYNTYTDTSFGSPATFYYKVAAMGINQQSEPSECVSVTVKKPLPSIPSGLFATSSSATSINLQFNPASNATGYIIYRGTSASSLNSIGITMTTLFEDKNLFQNTVYYYAVAATNGTDTSAVSAVTSIKSGAIVPSIPTGLVATAQSTTSIFLKFNEASNAEGYVIFKGTSENSLEIVDTITETSFTNSSLLSGTTYYYAVAAFNREGISLRSQTVSAKTQLAVPAAPTGLSVSAVSSSAIRIQFQSVATATQYIVSRGTNEGSLTQITTTNSLSLVDSNLISGTTYFYAVAATNSSGTSPFSSSVSAKTLNASYPPPTPTGLTLTAQSTSIQLQFNAVSGAKGYIIYRGTSSGSLTVFDTVTTTFLTDQNLQTGTTYYYAISAYNADGVSARSATSSATTQVTPPATPSGLRVSATTTNSITLQFNSVTDATGYKVYSSTDNNSFTQLASITATTYTHTGLSAATTRYYKVSSMKGSVESAQSNSVSGTTQNVVKKIAVVNTSVCTGCRECLPCDVGALTIVSKKAVIDPSKCNGCGKCVSRCRRGALSLR